MLYSLPDTAVPGTSLDVVATLLASRLYGVRVLDCLNTNGGHYYRLVRRADLQPRIVRTAAAEANACAARVQTHVHLLPITQYALSCSKVAPSARKFVLHLAWSAAPRHPSLVGWSPDLHDRDTSCPHWWRRPAIFCVREIVVVFDAAKQGSDAQNPADAAADDDDDDAAAAKGTKILTLVLFFIGSLHKRYKNWISTITIVDMPFPFDELGVLPEHKWILDRVEFADSAAYRKRVGEATWAAEADRGVIERMCGGGA